MIEIPGYKIIRTLGKGGMASVYLAIQSSFEREVALKVVNSHSSEDPKFTERFLREAKIVSRLVHPNIVTVYDVGVHSNQHYLSMEYVPGLDLKRRRQFMTLAESIQVIKDVAQALDYASKKGYVHRDVKPENIMLHEEDGRSVLMDFGIACMVDSHSGMTQTGTAIGTPHYMSPEQAKGKVVDARSDIYSLGVVFFLLMTGHVPYDADSAVAVGIKHVSDPIPRLPARLAALQHIIDKVLAKDPAERYQNGAELVADLERIPAGELQTIGKMTSRQLSQGAENSTAGSGVDPETPTPISTRVAAAETDPDRATMAATAVFDTDNSSAAQSAPHFWANPRAGRKAAPRRQPLREEVVSIDEEDRRPIDLDGEKKTRWPYWLAALLVVAVGAAVYFKQQLPPPMAAGVDEVIARSEAARDQLYTALGWEIPGADAAGPEPEPDALAITAADLRNQLASDSGVAPQLADTYRAMLSASPSDPSAQAGLTELQDLLFRRAREALAQRDLEAVDTQVASLNSSFPEAAIDPRYLRLIDQVASARAAQAVIIQGDEYLAADQLDSPEESNALAAYNQALALDPGNPLAEAGIARVVARYGTLAEADIAEGKWQAALNRINSGLAIAPDNEALNRLSQSASEGQTRQRSIDNLLARAKTRLDAGQLIAPAGEGAWHQFQQLLELDPGNTRAKRGLANIEETLAQRVEAAINREEFERGQQILREAGAFYPGSERLLEAEVILERAIEADFIARQPKVDKILVANSQAPDINQSQPVSLQPDRTLYFGFSYRNFQSSASVVQAVLYDGTRTIQIAQVPVLVSGAEGVKYFPIERPVDSFGAGRYNIDLLLNQDRLGTLEFRVENNN